MLINLCSMPSLSTDYSNVIDFDNESARSWYFEKQEGQKQIEVNTKIGSALNNLTVKLSIEELNLYDYLYLTYKEKQYFYFIIEKEMVNENNTILHLQKDVFTSHQFDVEYHDSFIERCHVPRWDYDTGLPTNNNVDEGLDFGELIQIGEAEVIKEFYTSVIMASSVPIGQLKSSGTGGGGTGTGTDATSWVNGDLSSVGFRFIKGFEGMGYKAYQDSGDYWTIGYGVTKHGEPSIYAEFVSLANNGGLTEEVSAKKSYALKNSNYGRKILSSVKNLGITKQCQFDALVSVAYNCGNGAITGDNTLTDAISKDPNNESVIRPVWEKFKITSNGIPLEGLRLRRIQECNMYFGKTHEVRSIQIVSGGSGVVTENNGNGWLPIDKSDSNTDFNGYKSFSNDFGNGWLCPVKGATVSSKYGWRTHPVTGERKFHQGTDFGKAEGSPTVASKTGVVEFSGFNTQGFGNLVILNHDNKYKSYYPHLSRISVKEGQEVKRGEEVGKIGTTGTSTGAHCHWEVRDYNTNESTDPAPILRVGGKV